MKKPWMPSLLAFGLIASLGSLPGCQQGSIEKGAPPATIAENQVALYAEGMV